MSKIIAIVAVVAIVAAGAGVIIYGNLNPDEYDGPVSIELTDSNGNTETYNFDHPLKRICVVSSNCMEWIQILGMSDMVVSACDLALKASTLDPELFKGATNVGATASASVEDIAASEAQLVITPAKSGLAKDKIENLLTYHNIPTITLSCNGDTMIQDAEALVKIADSSSAKSKFDGYKADCDAVHAKVVDAVKNASEVRAVMATVNSSVIKFYLPTSELGKIMESLKVTNPISPTSSSTVYGNPSYEKVIELDDKDSFDFALVRTMSSYDLQKVFAKYKDFYKEAASTYDNMECVKNNHVYSFEADVTSGAMTYIGEVLLCHLLGIDIDLHAGDLVDQFMEKYNFQGHYDYLAYNGTEYFGFRSA